MAATILLVEDNADHAEITMATLRHGTLVNDIVWVKDGAEALDFVFGRGQYVTAPAPCLILLDIGLPKVDGHAVLRRIKLDPELRRIPVVMLTTSEREDEVDRAYTEGANGFVTKPVGFDEYVEKMKIVKAYWMVASRLPEG